MTTPVLTGANVVEPRDGSIAWDMDVAIDDGYCTTVRHYPPETRPTSVASMWRG